jgi:integrase
MRLSEPLGLRWDDVDLATGAISVPRVRVRGVMIEKKVELLTTVDGRPTDHPQAQKPFNRLVKGTEVTRSRFHDLRHTHASLPSAIRPTYEWG